MMGANNRTSGTIWLTLAKILIFFIALFLAYLILKPLLSVLLSLGFWVFKVIVFIGAGLIIIHLFLKIIFDIDLIYLIFGRRWPR